jgi:ABC-type multidrug transport system permease subunit
VAIGFGVVIQLGHVVGGEPWGRLPLLAAGLALTGGALGALGALIGGVAREARTASLVSVLVVLPIVFLGLIPSEFFAAAGWVSDALPFAHGVRFFSAALFDNDPWGSVARESGWLVALGLLYGGGSVLAVRTLRG